VEKRQAGSDWPTDAGWNRVLLSRFVLFGQLSFGSSASRATFENIAVVEQAVEHGGDGGAAE